MNPAFNLTGQTALITGGGTGLGFGMAKCLLASGGEIRDWRRAAGGRRDFNRVLKSSQGAVPVSAPA